MMVGASQAHNLVTGNVFAAIRQSLKGQTCRVFAADGKVVTPKGNYRYPDVTVDCGAFDPKATVLAQPALVVEVLSKATHWIDTTRKLEEYKAIASMRYILFLSQEDFRAQLWTRGDAWQLREYEGLGSTLPLPPFAPALTFAAIYEGIEFES